jgi:hypothetical protein
MCTNAREICDAQGKCQSPVPNCPAEKACTGVVCGLDPVCHESCAECAAGEVCDNGTCKAGCQAPEGWPPDVTTLFDVASGACVNVPPCEATGDPCFNFTAANGWVQRLTTTASDCPDLVKQTDKRANVGNVVEIEDTVPVEGNCAGTAAAPAGTIHKGILAMCGERTEDEQMGIKIYYSAVIDYGKGEGKAAITLIIPEGLKALMNNMDTCKMSMDIKTWKK